MDRFTESTPFVPVDTASLQRLVESGSEVKVEETTPIRPRLRSQTIDWLKGVIRGVKDAPKSRNIHSWTPEQENVRDSPSPTKKSAVEKSINVREFSLKGLERVNKKKKKKEVKPQMVQEKAKKKVKPKKKKFRKADFINEMKETENLLLEYENTRNIMEKDRMKMYQYWDLTTSKIVAAQKSKSHLKKKVKALEMEDDLGLWEVSRRDKLNVISRYHIQLRKTKQMYIESLTGALNQLNTKSDAYLKDVKDIKHSTVKIGQEIAVYSFENWKNSAENKSKLIEQCLPYIEIKSLKLNERLANTIGNTALELKGSYGMTLKERENRIEENFHHNFDTSNRLLSLYTTIMDSNFPSIQKLAQIVVKKQRIEHHLKKEKVEIGNTLTHLKDRMAFLRERCSELKKYVVNGTIIRKEIIDLLLQRKRYLAKYSTSKIYKEQMYQTNDVINQTCQEKRKLLVGNMFKAKKDLFKGIICASLMSYDTAIELQEFIKLIKHGWNVEVDPLFYPKLFMPKDEFKAKSEGIKVEFGNYLREKSHKMHHMSKTTVELYYSYMLLFDKILTKNALHVEDLKFRMSGKEFPEILSVIGQKERKVFNQIKKDIDALNSRGS